ncbi:MAG: cytochrome c oxidase subunit II [Acidobacteria bacterium]|nr:cytochrome c oxidase subunit II [Acidobacteriota bacterium]
MRFFAALAIWLVAAALLAPVLLGWWAPPEAISDLARLLDDQLALTFTIIAIIFVISQAALGYAVLRFGRERAEPAAYFEKNDRWEMLWTTAASVLFLGLALMGYSAWAEVRFDSARVDRDADALQVEVVAQQFVWNFRYAGADGRFGPIDPKLIDDSIGNPVGVDRSHADGADDIISPRLVVPVNREVTLLLKSKDVLHNFFVPELRIKMDTVPGLVGRLPFKADKLGEYEIACSELCGLGHYRMRGYLEVVDEQRYKSWMMEQVSYLP